MILFFEIFVNIPGDLYAEYENDLVKCNQCCLSDQALDRKHLIIHYTIYKLIYIKLNYKNYQWTAVIQSMLQSCCRYPLEEALLTARVILLR